MLRRIGIRDFVIVERSELEFEGGFTVLTGETGAGKSILVDALSLVLGERGEASAVRRGARQAEVSAEFDVEFDGEVERWLTAAGLEGDPGQCLVRRVLEAGGRSRGFVNGRAATVAQLRELGELLVDIHGQHAHQSLLRAASQRELLDDYAGAIELVAGVEAAFRRWSELAASYQSAQTDADRMQSEREQLAWKVAELARLEFDPTAWQEIGAEHGRLTHAAALIETVSASLDALSEDEQSASSLINATVSRLTRAAEHDPTLRTVLDVLEPAQIQLKEAVYALERYQTRLEVDPRRLAQVERRLEEVHEVCRKFRLTPESLADALEAARARLGELELGLDLARLEAELAIARSAYAKVADALTKVRKKAAGNLAREVSAALQELALVGGRFEVALERLPEGSAHGQERVEFRVAAHAGMEPGPLGKVASGGELSRVSLAIQTVLSQVARVPTLIFDEVDAGIGGRVAEIVGQMLHRLGGRHQVMCVTHLAQVAVCADHHWRVQKVETGGQVMSRVEPLSGKERTDEVARMLGGIEVTRATREHATEMLKHAARRA